MSTDRDRMRAVLLRHHPIMRSETGSFSGCRCGGVQLGQDVIAHVLDHLLALRAPMACGSDLFPEAAEDEPTPQEWADASAALGRVRPDLVPTFDRIAAAHAPGGAAAAVLEALRNGMCPRSGKPIMPRGIVRPACAICDCGDEPTPEAPGGAAVSDEDGSP